MVQTRRQQEEQNAKLIQECLMRQCVVRLEKLRNEGIYSFMCIVTPQNILYNNIYEEFTIF